MPWAMKRRQPLPKKSVVWFAPVGWSGTVQPREHPAIRLDTCEILCATSAKACPDPGRPRTTCMRNVRA
eukprot:8233136-Pyramimonas_sp.AAC.1